MERVTTIAAVIKAPTSTSRRYIAAGTFILLGLIDRGNGNVNAKEGLIRPRVDLRKHRSTKIPAAKNARSRSQPRKNRVAKMQTRQRRVVR